MAQRDGRQLTYVVASPETDTDIWILTFEDDNLDSPHPGRPKPFLQTRFRESAPAFSFDGNWIAFESNQSGRLEVYVRSLAPSGGLWQVSVDGGQSPVWSRNRHQLFYLSNNRQISVVDYRIERGAFVAGPPRRWSEFTVPVAQNTIRNFDLTASGDRCLSLAETENPPDATPQTELTLMLNFFDEVRRLTP